MMNIIVIIIATKTRGKKEATLVDMKKVLEPYTEPEEIEVLKDACNSI